MFSGGAGWSRLRHFKIFFSDISNRDEISQAVRNTFEELIYRKAVEKILSADHFLRTHIVNNSKN